VFLSLLSALLLLLAFPRFDLHLLAWIGLVPLLLALRWTSFAGAFGLGCVTGVALFKGVLYWVNSDQGVAWAEAIPPNLYLGAWVGIFALAQSFVSRRSGLPATATAPAIWVAVEYLRSNAGFLALPWALLGHTQYENLPLIQVSALTGVYGLSFLIVMVNALLAEALARWRGWPTAVSRHSLAAQAVLVSGLLVASLAYGLTVTSRAPAARHVTVGLVQGNVPQRERWERELIARNIERHVRLTAQAAQSGHPALIVWPETSVPALITQDIVLSRKLGALARDSAAHLLIGSAIRPKFGPSEVRRKSFSNSAFLYSPAGAIVGRYDKLRLLPFAEYLPYADVLPWPAALAAKAAHFVPGRAPTLFDLDGAPFGVLICWEVIFPDLARALVRRGATFLVNIGNEAWFGESAAPYQFLAISVFRAVEHRVAVARAVNTGISAFIDPLGRVTGRVSDGEKDVFVAGFLTGRMPVSREPTFYTRYGDLFAGSALMATALMLAAGVRPRADRPAVGWSLPRDDCGRGTNGAEYR
jgi:apolipoprotein N-acyltransferase